MPVLVICFVPVFIGWRGECGVGGGVTNLHLLLSVDMNKFLLC